MDNNTCSICWEDTILISCEYCSNKICKNCLEMCILKNMKRCIECKLEYTRMFIHQNTNKETFVKYLEQEYNDILETIILPELKQYKAQKDYSDTLRRKEQDIRNKKDSKYQIKETKQRQLDDLARQILGDNPEDILCIFQTYDSLPKDQKDTYRDTHSNHFDLADKLHQDKIDMEQQVKNITDEISRLEIELIDFKKQKDNIEYLEYHNFCPICNALVMSNKCTSCNIMVCPKCQEPIQMSMTSNSSKSHVCNQDTLDTIRYLENDENTKHCPVCNIRISKIEGCNDFFCVNCKSCFNWRSLKLTKTAGDNPHYVEYLRSKNKQESDWSALNDNTELLQIYRIIGKKSLVYRNIKYIKRSNEIVQDLNWVQNRFNKDERIKRYLEGQESFDYTICLLYNYIIFIRCKALVQQVHQTFISRVVDILYSYIPKVQHYSSITDKERIQVRDNINTELYNESRCIIQQLNRFYDAYDNETNGYNQLQLSENEYRIYNEINTERIHWITTELLKVQDKKPNYTSKNTNIDVFKLDDFSIGELFM